MADEAGEPLPEGYMYLRGGRRFGYTLLGIRMTYYLTSQSFLFTASAIARGVQWHSIYWFSGAPRPLVVVAASAVLLNAINAAFGRMDAWRAKEKGFAETHLLVVMRPEDKHRKSPMFTTLMPRLLIALWLTFAVLIHLFRPGGGGMQPSLLPTRYRPRGTLAGPRGARCNLSPASPCSPPVWLPTPASRTRPACPRCPSTSR